MAKQSLKSYIKSDIFEICDSIPHQLLLSLMRRPVSKRFISKGSRICFIIPIIPFEVTLHVYHSVQVTAAIVKTTCNKLYLIYDKKTYTLSINTHKYTRTHT